MNQENIQQPTSNAQHPLTPRLAAERSRRAFGAGEGRWAAPLGFHGSRSVAVRRRGGRVNCVAARGGLTGLRSGGERCEGGGFERLGKPLKRFTGARASAHPAEAGC